MSLAITYFGVQQDLLHPKHRSQRQKLFHGGMTLVPMQHSHWGPWNQPHEGFAISLKPELLTRNAAELLAVDQVELL